MSKGFSLVRSLQDRILILKTKAGDERAYAQIYDRYFKDVYSFIYFKVPTREVAEDLAAEVFLKVWQYLAREKEVHNIQALLYRSARNAVVDYYRKRKDESLEEEDERMNVESRAYSLFESIAQRDELDGLMSIVASLKDEYREVIVLRYVQELSHAEIAQILGKRKGAIRVLLHRAVKEVKARLKAMRKGQTDTL